MDEWKKLKWLQRSGVPFKCVPAFYKCTDTSEVNENHYAVGLGFEEAWQVPGRASDLIFAFITWLSNYLSLSFLSS